METLSKRTSRAGGSVDGKILLLWLITLLVLDFATTTLGLSMGFRELNPLVRSLIRMAGVNGLVISRVAAIALAAYFFYSGRIRLLRRATVFMGIVVGWNVLWLVVR